MTQHDMLLLQRRQKELVDRPDHKAREKRLLSSAEPWVNDQTVLNLPVVVHRRAAAKYRPVFLVHFGHAVGQTDGQLRALRLFFRPGCQAAENPICRRLRRKTEEYASAAASFGEHLRGSQSGLRFAHAHLGF